MVLPLLVVLAQADAAPAPAAVPAPEALTPEEKAQKALDQLTDAARRLAEAAERISPPPPVAVETTPPEKIWSATLNLGATWVTGNVNSLAFVAGGAATRKTGRTIFNLKAFGGYGETFNDDGTTSVLILNAGLTGQFDYRFTNHISAFIGGGLDTDHVKSVELRGYGDLGAGVLWLDRKDGPAGKEYQTLLLKTDLSVRVQPETRFQYYPTPVNVDDALLIGPRAAILFHFGMSAATYFHEELEVIPNVLKPRVQLNSTSKVAVGIASALSLNAAFQVKYDSEPAPTKKTTDTILSVGVEANF